jgi:Iap family predicted aminopeptidase
LDVVLELRQGNLARAVLTGPELFTRVGEAAQVQAIVPDDVMGRATAISEAMNLLEPLLDQRFPPERCAREAVSPVVVYRECDGLRVVVIASAAPKEDRIVIEPAPAAPEVP